MKQSTTTILTVLLIISLTVNGWLYVKHYHSGAKGQTSANTAEVYACPMHPQVVADHPADCPICGMKLVKRTAGGGGKVADSLASTVNFNPSQEILANIRTEAPTRMKFNAELTVPGTLIAREDASWKASVRSMGRIEKLYISTPGKTVNAGDPLFDLYSPDIASAQKEYLLALKSAGNNSEDAVVAATKSKLLSLGMEPSQVSELETNRTVKETLTYRAARAGSLMEKMGSEGEWVMSSMTILDFIDLSSVWVEGRMYEKDAGKVRMGQPVTVSPANGGGQSANATVSWISPMVDMMNRALPFRATLVNSGGNWKLGMFVTVKVGGTQSQVLLSLPEDAVLSTGSYNRVWVLVQAGHYQPRIVVTGTHADGRIAILQGLDGTEMVVVNGGYLIDSDAQIRNIGGSMPGMDMSKPMQSEETVTPSMDMSKSPAKPVTAKPAVEAPAKPLYYCPMNDSPPTDKPGQKCPVCGMKMVLR